MITRFRNPLSSILISINVIKIALHFTLHSRFNFVYVCRLCPILWLRLVFPHLEFVLVALSLVVVECWFFGCWNRVHWHSLCNLASSRSSKIFQRVSSVFSGVRHHSRVSHRCLSILVCLSLLSAAKRVVCRLQGRSVGLFGSKNCNPRLRKVVSWLIFDTDLFIADTSRFLPDSI